MNKEINLSSMVMSWIWLVCQSIHGGLVKTSRFIISPTGITLLTLLIFSASLTWFFYVIANVKMELMEAVQFKDQWRNLILGLGTIAIFITRHAGIQNWMQKQILLVFEAVISLTYLIVISVYFFLIEQPYEYLLALDVGTFVVTISIIIGSIRHNVIAEE